MVLPPSKLLPSPLQGKAEDFDKLKEYVISGKDFKSWNNDPNFKENGLNALYFKYTKLYKVQVDFITDPIMVGVVDVVSWFPEHPKYEVKPTVLHLRQPRKGASFQFYVNPFHMNQKKGYFEPRVYSGLHTIKKVKIMKLVSLKSNKKYEYALFLLNRAKEMLDIADEQYLEGDFGLSIHFSRYAIELSLKSIYPMFGMYFTRRHDIDFPPDLRQRISKTILRFPFSRLLWICQHYLRPDRIDFYGDEISFVPPYAVVRETDAKRALDEAQFCYQHSSALFDRL